MKIASSHVAMASSHELETHVSVKKASLDVRAENGVKAKEAVAAIYESSKKKSVVAAMEEYREKVQMKHGEAVSKPQEHAPSPDRLPGRQSCGVFDFRMDDASELKVRLLNRLLEALGGKGRVEPIRIGGCGEEALDFRGKAARTAGVRSQLFSMSVSRFSASSISVSFAAARTADGAAVGTSSAGTLWQRVDAVSTERSERETTAFRSQGLAVTEDGRSIGFNVEFAMSRSFTEKFEALSSRQYVLTDPLIINLDSSTASVSDTKFLFDLDGDGEEENISFAGRGSGFLALDRDGNGKIDNGSELFGTKSGDGFADLAAYDGDGNGWIDENDDVYSKLRVWVKDENGDDRLLDLKEADVGAIYLGSADTEFSLNDAVTNETNGVIRRTGVYLKESGGAGTLSHVDLSC